MLKIFILYFYIISTACSSFIKDDGALYLTELIKKNKIEEAQHLAKVHHPEFDHFFDSYSGYLTVGNAKCNSNLFFWFFPAQNNFKNAPVLLWLQGGPGASAIQIGLFRENGPLVIENEKVQLRKQSWSLFSSILYIDSPVGTGFSFTGDESCYATNQDQIADNLYDALTQFFQLFPTLQKNNFYITGESYAGKYIPSLAYKIHNTSRNDLFPINLKGLAIGNGMTDPINQLDFGKFLYQLGLIDLNAKAKFEDIQNQTAQAIEAQNWTLANVLFHKLVVFNNDVDNGHNLFRNYTGLHDIYNVLTTIDMSDYTEHSIRTFLDSPDMRKAIHVGKNQINSEEKVRRFLEVDFMQSVAPKLKELLSYYPTLIYSGQLDACIPYTTTENFLSKLEFDGAEEYKKAERQIWKVNGQVAGYFKKAKNLIEVLVRDSGHMVPTDQPKWALDLITKFVQNKF